VLKTHFHSSLKQERVENKLTVTRALDGSTSLRLLLREAFKSCSQQVECQMCEPVFWAPTHRLNAGEFTVLRYCEMIRPRRRLRDGATCAYRACATSARVRAGKFFSDASSLPISTAATVRTRLPRHGRAAANP